MTKSYKLSIVFPCYNEAESLPWLFDAFEKERDPRITTEMIIVNNGSSDDSGRIIQSYLEKSPWKDYAQCVSIEKNVGYGHGIFSGLQKARGEYLAWTHADTQYSPKVVFEAFDKLNQSLNPERTFVKGLRRKRPFSKSWTTIGMQMVARLFLRQPLTDINGQPKVFHRSFLEKTPEPPVDLSFDLYMYYHALKSGLKIDTIDVNFDQRKFGESRWDFNFSSKMKNILHGIKYIFSLALHDK